MIRCRAVAELLSSDQLRDVGLLKRLEVKLHLAMCRYCSRFAKQLEQLRSAARRQSEHLDADPGLEDRLLRKISDRK